MHSQLVTNQTLKNGSDNPRTKMNVRETTTKKENKFKNPSFIGISMYFNPAIIVHFMYSEYYVIKK